MAVTIDIGDADDIHPKNKADVGERLALWALRDNFGLTGTKFGCGVAACGACTVHVNGEPTRACVTPVSAIEGKRVVTIEDVVEEIAALVPATVVAFYSPIDDGSELEVTQAAGAHADSVIRRERREPRLR